MKSTPEAAPVQNRRLLNRDGTFNVVRVGTGHSRMTDLYHTLLSAPWIVFLALLGGFYILLNLAFAGSYVLCGPGALEGIVSPEPLERFSHAFFFSVQTFATIGYGKITPVGLAANLLVTVEALVGLLYLALATGLLFSRFARPTARVIFSNNAIIANHDGVPSLLFRIGNKRLNQIVDAQINVVLAKNEVTAEGEKYRDFYDLKLERSRSPIFALTWTVVHPIDLQSPLSGMTIEKMNEAEAEIIVNVVGIDDTFSQTIHARSSYKPWEILFDKKFVDILSRSEDGKILIDLSKLHLTV